MTLTQAIYRTYDELLFDCEASYKGLDKIISSSDHKDKNRIKRKLERANKKVERARKKLERIAASDSHKFAEKNFIELKAAHRALNEGLPDHDTIEGIQEIILEDLVNKPIAKMYGYVKRLLPVSAILSSASAIGTSIIGSPIATAIYASSTAAALWEKFSTNESISRVGWANGGLIVGAGALLLSADIEPHSTDAYIFGGLVLAQTVTMRLLHVTIRYFEKRAEAKIKAAEVENTRTWFDGLARAGVVIEEANRNLGYVGRVCSSEKRPQSDFEVQVDRLESVLTDYLFDEATFDDVVEARIKYIPKDVKPKEKVERQSTDNRGSYRIGESERNEAEVTEPSRKRKRRRRREQAVEADTIEQISTVTVSFSPRLEALYATSKRVGGFTYGPIMDLTRQKIESNPKGTYVAPKTVGKKLNEKIWNRHDLPNGTKIFKMQPANRLRALYLQNGKEITVLEILHHEEYDKLMDK